MEDQIYSESELSNNSRWSVTYNAVFTLTFCLIATAMLLFNTAAAGLINQVFSLSPNLSLEGSYRLITYIVCHSNFDHLFGNCLFLLMLGPILEEKYGSKILAVMTLMTAIVTGLVNAALFDEGIIGASGIVFMFIILSSIVNMKRKEIPLTFIFVVVIFLGKEVIHSFGADNISQFGHIFGGLCGAILGFVFNRRQ